MRFPIYSLIILIIACFGVTYISTAVHEYTHLYDYRSINDNLTKKMICVTELPTENISLKTIFDSRGYYTFAYNPDNTQLASAINQIEKYSEYKAYSSSVIIFIIFAFLFVKFMEELFSLKEKIEIRKWELGIN